MSRISRTKYWSNWNGVLENSICPREKSRGKLRRGYLGPMTFTGIRLDLDRVFELHIDREYSPVQVDGQFV